MSSHRAFKVLGRRTIRRDGIAKVTGREMYASDIALPYTLHARVLKRSYPHVRVRSIDISGAEAMGAIVVTFEETPNVRFCPRLVSTPEVTYKDWHVLTGEPLYVGEPIAAVAAETE